MTKKYFEEILEDALTQAKKELEASPSIPLNSSIYNQLIDIKATVVEHKLVLTESQSRDRYPLGVQVVRNFDGYLDTEWDYPKKLIDIAGGISRYPNMPDR